jgi:hypothetical protein
LNAWRDATDMPASKLFPIILLPLAAVAIIAIVSPGALVSRLGGPRTLKSPARELFLRIAGALFLVGAAIACFRELNS